jgi:hypothetical protein
MTQFVQLFVVVAALALHGGCATTVSKTYQLAPGMSPEEAKDTIGSS